MAKSVNLKAPISRVTVFRGAQIERSCSLPSSGESLSIAGLPLTLLDDSVQVSLKNVPDNLLTSGVRVQLEVDASSSRNSLVDEIQQSVVKCEVLKAELKTLEELLAELQIVEPKSRQSSQSEELQASASLSKRLEFLDFKTCLLYTSDAADE